MVQGQLNTEPAPRGAGRREWPSWKAHLVFWAVLAGGLGLDLWTKTVVFGRIGPDEAVQVVPGCLRLVTRLNSGAAFSLASGGRPFLIGISSVAFLVILGLFLLGGRKPMLITVVLGTFGGGVLGNLWDRVFNHGLVRDFIDAYVHFGQRELSWPTFNVADTLLCVAVGLLVIASLRRTTEPPCRTRGRSQR